MAIFYDAPVSPDELTAFTREVPVGSNLQLLNMFPVTVKATNTVNFSEITRTNRTARYRAFDGAIHVADRDGYSDKVIKMPPMSDSLNMGEYERLQLEFAKTGGTRTSALADAIYDDGTTLTRYVQNRAEQALGDVLTDGKFSPAELPGMETDFGVPANHKITVATPWTTVATADMFGDLVAACDAYEATNGFRPGFALTSRRVQRTANQNVKLINAVKGAQTGVTRISLSDASNVFDSEGVPTNWITYENNLDVDGVSTRSIPDDLIILGPPNPEDLLEFRFGLSATALELVNSNEAELSFEEAAGIVGVVIKAGPPFRQFTFVDAVGMPILKDAKKLMIVKAL